MWVDLTCRRFPAAGVSGSARNVAWTPARRPCSILKEPWRYTWRMFLSENRYSPALRKGKFFRNMR
jgi:hypothetical protein